MGRSQWLIDVAPFSNPAARTLRLSWAGPLDEEEARTFCLNQSRDCRSDRAAGGDGRGDRESNHSVGRRTHEHLIGWVQTGIPPLGDSAHGCSLPHTVTHREGKHRRELGGNFHCEWDAMMVLIDGYNDWFELKRFRANEMIHASRVGISTSPRSLLSPGWI